MKRNELLRDTRAILVVLCGLAASVGPFAPSARAQNEPQIHDPVMAKQGDTYYAFGTGAGIAVMSSKDMKTWKAEPPVFDQLPEWVKSFLPNSRNSEWAPDIFMQNGTYYMYYAVSAFGKNTSAIGVATNSTLDRTDPKFKWVDHGMVMKSVPGRDMWNAIDPNVFVDEEGKAWMDFGSFWGGIKLFRLKDDLLSEANRPTANGTRSRRRERYWKIDEKEAGDAANPDLKYDVIYPKEILGLDQAMQNGSIEAPSCSARTDTTTCSVVGPLLPRREQHLQGGRGPLEKACRPLSGSGGPEDGLGRRYARDQRPGLQQALGRRRSQCSLHIRRRGLPRLPRV